MPNCGCLALDGVLTKHKVWSLLQRHCRHSPQRQQWLSNGSQPLPRQLTHWMRCQSRDGSVVQMGLIGNGVQLTWLYEIAEAGWSHSIKLLGVWGWSNRSAPWLMRTSIPLSTPPASRSYTCTDGTVPATVVHQPWRFQVTPTLIQ